MSRHSTLKKSLLSDLKILSRHPILKKKLSIGYDLTSRHFRRKKLWPKNPPILSSALAGLAIIVNDSKYREINLKCGILLRLFWLFLYS